LGGKREERPAIGREQRPLSRGRGDVCFSVCDVHYGKWSFQIT